MNSIEWPTRDCSQLPQVTPLVTSPPGILGPDGQWTQQERQHVINHLDPIENLYNMYSGEEETPRIVELMDKQLDLELELGDRLANLYLEL